MSVKMTRNPSATAVVPITTIATVEKKLGVYQMMKKMRKKVKRKRINVKLMSGVTDAYRWYSDVQGRQLMNATRQHAS